MMFVSEAARDEALMAIAPRAEQGFASKSVKVGHEHSTNHHRDYARGAIHGGARAQARRELSAIPLVLLEARQSEPRSATVVQLQPPPAQPGVCLLASRSKRGALPHLTSPTMSAMKKDEATPPNSNTSCSSISSASPPALTNPSASSRFRFPSEKTAAPSSNPALALCASRNNAMKALITITAILGVASAAHAQYVVTDPMSDVLNQVMHLQDIAKTVEMINNQVQQINTLTQELQQTQAYVKAFGNPEQLLHIVGADELIRSLTTPGVGQPLIQLQSGASGSEAFRDNQNGLYLKVGSNITTPNGSELPRDEELYRKFAASDAAIQNFKTVFNDVSQRREVLKRQIADTTQQLQAATTAAETQKLTGVLAGYNAGLAAADKEVDQALGESVVPYNAERLRPREAGPGAGGGTQSRVR